MILIVKRATLASMAATFLMLVYSAAGSGAAAQEKTPVQAQTDSTPAIAAPVGTQAETAAVAAPSADSLADLVAAQPDEAQVSDEINCLAGAIYFEARNEPLDGQLAVGRVIVNRSKSGRFPASYCAW
jgi:spore germination cell wall hydrolase CwlJ-like protein